MSDIWTLEDVDRDGAIQEAAAQVDPLTRASFLKKAGIGAGAVVGGGALMGAIPSLAFGAGFPASDVAILNFALTLEYLEAAFYNEAVAKGSFTGDTNTFARVVAGHENAHVKFLKGALGSAAVKTPTFDFKDTTSDQSKFEATATVLEDTGVQAYLIREIRLAKTQGTIPAPTAFQGSKTKAEILAAVRSTGFITA
jgi:Ferritin-like domain